ncbi:hypothetical protein [Clostridium sp.]|uniref:hypothetical protein n=1 Tax=Clostridium sp. TaxID=1506 RepID=UPI003217FB5C
MKKIFLLNTDSFNEFEQLMKEYNKSLISRYLKGNSTLEKENVVISIDKKIVSLLNERNVGKFNIDINEVNSFIDENSKLKVILNGNYVKNHDIDKVMGLIDGENEDLLDPIKKVLKVALKKEAHLVFYYI